MAELTREAISRYPARRLSSGRNRTKADVILLERNGGVVVKDFRARSFLVRSTLGRFSIARECRAYARLTGLEGIPGFIGRVDPFAVAFSFVPGPSLRDLPKRSLPPPFFAALGRLIDAVHARGVAIVDLHHRNVLVSPPGGTPALLDFSLAISRPSAWNLPARWFFARALALDRLAFERIRARYEAPESGGARAPVPTTTLHAAGRTLKAWLRRILGKV